MKNKYVVSGNLGRFKADTVLTDQDSIVAYYRAMYEEGNDGKPLSLTDTEVMAVLEAIPDNDDRDAAEMDRVIALGKGNAVKPEISAQGSIIRQHATEFGRRLPPEFDEVMGDGLKAKETTDDLPLALAITVDRALHRGNNGLITDPIPGTVERLKVKDKNGVTRELQCENPARSRIKIGQKTRTVNFYADAWAQRQEGKALQATIDQIKSWSETIPDVVETIKHSTGEVTTRSQFKPSDKPGEPGMSAKDRASALEKYKSAFQYGVTKLERAVNFILQVEAIGNMPHVDMTLASEPAKGSPEIKIAGVVLCPANRRPLKTTKPIIMIDPDNKGSSEDPISITSFLSYKIKGGINDPYNDDDKAVDEDTTLAALLQTAARPPKGAATTGDVAAINGGDLDTWTKYGDEFIAWFTDRANYEVLNRELANGKLDPGFLADLTTLNTMLGAFVAKPAVKKLVAAFEAGQADEDEAEEDAA